MDGWIIWIVGWMDEWIVWIWIYHVKVGKKAFRSGAEVCTSEATIRTFALRENASLFVNLLLNVSPEPVLANGRGIPSETSPPPKKKEKKRERHFSHLFSTQWSATHPPGSTRTKPTMLVIVCVIAIAVCAESLS
jgi:hypothetical protein